MEALRKLRQMLGLDSTFGQLSNFQRAKLLHEFVTFYDINKDGRLQWKDFELARDYICSKSGWQPGSAQCIQCRQLFVEMWRNLQDDADENMDGEITVDEWLQMWTKINRAKLKSDRSSSSSSKAAVRTPRLGTSKNPPSEDKSSTAAAAVPGHGAGQPPTNRVPVDQRHQQQQQQPCEESSYLPSWFDRYVEYKFNLLDRAGDGILDEEEFEFTLSDGFDISPNDCRIAYRIFSENGGKKVDFSYFYEMALQFYLSDNPSDLGNFINGKLQYE